jgi:subtilisin family serine protease
MRSQPLYVFLIAVCFSFTTGVKAGVADSQNMRTLLAQPNADRLLLVGFTDNTINSVKGSASPTSYRQRGSYQSSTWSERVTNQLADDYGLEKLAEWPMTEVGVHCVVYRVSGKASVDDAIARLKNDDRVEVVQNMHVFKTKAQSTKNSNDPYFKLQTNLQQMNVNLAHHRATGKNIKIGMIDTGVDLEHPDLSGQISDEENFAESISPSFSTDKHGTAVAGIMVAKRDNAKGIIGIAPDASLIALKACWPSQADAMEAVCNSYTLALAVNTAIKKGVDILNMSLIGPDDPILALLIEKAINKGIVVVAADTGKNDSAENFPASMKGVISVQSLDKDQPTSGSINNNEAISAPGETVLTTLPHGTYDFISGSSIAAAEVSGIVALLLEIEHSLTPEKISAILKQAKLTAKNGEIAGINANAALDRLCQQKGCASETISFATAGTL